MARGVRGGFKDDGFHLDLDRASGWPRRKKNKNKPDRNIQGMA